MASERAKRIIGSVALGAAVLLLLTGSVRKYRVYDRDSGDYGMLTFHRISDRQLVIDTTFSGVLRKGDRLFSTYDRTVARGKRSCPT